MILAASLCAVANLGALSTAQAQVGVWGFGASGQTQATISGLGVDVSTLSTDLTLDQIQYMGDRLASSYAQTQSTNPNLPDFADALRSAFDQRASAMSDVANSIRSSISDPNFISTLTQIEDPNGNASPVSSLSPSDQRRLMNSLDVQSLAPFESLGLSADTLMALTNVVDITDNIANAYREAGDIYDASTNYSGQGSRAPTSQIISEILAGSRPNPLSQRILEQREASSTVSDDAASMFEGLGIGSDQLLSIYEALDVLGPLREIFIEIGNLETQFDDNNDTNISTSSHPSTQILTIEQARNVGPDDPRWNIAQDLLSSHDVSEVRIPPDMMDQLLSGYATLTVAALAPIYLDVDLERGERIERIVPSLWERATSNVATIPSFQAFGPSQVMVTPSLWANTPSSAGSTPIDAYARGPSQVMTTPNVWANTPSSVGTSPNVWGATGLSSAFDRTQDARLDRMMSPNQGRGPAPAAGQLCGR